MRSERFRDFLPGANVLLWIDPPPEYAEGFVGNTIGNPLAQSSELRQQASGKDSNCEQDPPEENNSVEVEAAVHTSRDVYASGHFLRTPSIISGD